MALSLLTAVSAQHHVKFFWSILYFIFIFFYLLSVFLKIVLLQIKVCSVVADWLGSQPYNKVTNTSFFLNPYRRN